MGDTDDKKDVRPAVVQASTTPKPPAVTVPTSTVTRTYPVYTYRVPGPMPELPKLYVTRMALAEMTAEVLAHPAIETAWGLYGFRYPKAVFVVGVLRPVADEVVRGYANAEAGGQEMANAMRWLYANEKLIEETRIGSKKNGHGRFAFLYKGHSHHVLGYNQYSSTDHNSICEVVKKDGLNVAVGPLALIRANSVSYSHVAPWSNEVSASRYSRVSYLFYMMTKEMIDAGYTEAVTVKPTIVETVNTLLVPPLGWEFAQDDVFKTQLRHLKNYGCTVKVNHVDINNKPPLEIQFVVDHAKFKATLIITTDWNYPEAAPKIQLIPKSDTMTFADANRLSALTWWYKGEDFIDIVGRMLEKGCL